MARSKLRIHESLEELEQLEEEHRGGPLEARITMLKLLKNGEFSALNDILPQLNCSERSLQRWCGAYRKDGLSGLLKLGQRGGKRPRRINDEALQELRKKLASEGFTELKEAQQWLQEQHGVSYSRSGAWHLMRSAVGAVPRGWTMVGDPMGGSTSVADSPSQAQTAISGDIVGFLNALPISSNVLEWGSTFKDSLRALLGDVDRISINVNTNCDLSTSEGSPAILFITQSIDPEDEHGLDVNTARTSSSAPFERLLETFGRQGFPFDDYHQPHCFDYYYGSTYLGTIFLWREAHKASISEKTLEMLETLEPFIIFALSDLVARHQSEKPVDRVFNNALAALVSEAGLTSQEQRIVVLQLMGHAYKEMADILDVSIDTVKKHFKQIHRKTGTRGQAELFAKYFTSRLIPEDLRRSAQ